jgi:hypothetical protein
VSRDAGHRSLSWNREFEMAKATDKNKANLADGDLNATLAQPTNRALKPVGSR